MDCVENYKRVIITYKSCTACGSTNNDKDYHYCFSCFSNWNSGMTWDSVERKWKKRGDAKCMIEDD